MEITPNLLIGKKGSIWESLTGLKLKKKCVKVMKIITIWFSDTNAQYGCSFIFMQKTRYKKLKLTSLVQVI